MTIQEIIQDFGVEYLGRFYSTYRAIVTDNNDPDNLGRLFVSIPSIHDGIETWAFPKHQDGGPSYGVKGMTPKIGQIIYVEFEYGDPIRALWSYHSWAVGEKPDEFDNHTFGIITPGGIKVLINELENTIIVDSPGNISIKTTKDITINSTNLNFIEGKVGIPESNKVLSRLNEIEDKINTIMNAITNSTVTPQDGGAALKLSITEKMGDNINKTSLGDITSEHIKQPN